MHWVGYPTKLNMFGVLDQTCDVHMFTLQPKWLHNVYEYLLVGMML
jgi:hypothetical protein